MSLGGPRNETKIKYLFRDVHIRVCVVMVRVSDHRFYSSISFIFFTISLYSLFLIQLEYFILVLNMHEIFATGR